MVWLKCCPKCNYGDLYEREDIYGGYIACLQCGYYLNQAEEIALRYTAKYKAAASTTGAFPPEPLVATTFSDVAVQPARKLIWRPPVVSTL